MLWKHWSSTQYQPRMRQSSRFREKMWKGCAEMRGIGGTSHDMIVYIAGIGGTSRCRLVMDALVVMVTRVLSTTWDIGGWPAQLTAKQRNKKTKSSIEGSIGQETR